MSDTEPVFINPYHIATTKSVEHDASAVQMISMRDPKVQPNFLDLDNPEDSGMSLEIPFPDSDPQREYHLASQGIVKSIYGEGICKGLSFLAEKKEALQFGNLPSSQSDELRKVLYGWNVRDFDYSNVNWKMIRKILEDVKTGAVDVGLDEQSVLTIHERLKGARIEFPEEAAALVLARKAQEAIRLCPSTPLEEMSGSERTTLHERTHLSDFQHDSGRFLKMYDSFRQATAQANGRKEDAPQLNEAIYAEERIRKMWTILKDLSEARAYIAQACGTMVAEPANVSYYHGILILRIFDLQLGITTGTDIIRVFMDNGNDHECHWGGTLLLTIFDPMQVDTIVENLNYSSMKPYDEEQLMTLFGELIDNPKRMEDMLMQAQGPFGELMNKLMDAYDVELRAFLERSKALSERGSEIPDEFRVLQDYLDQTAL
jgi:hypothetical protein